jgi:four helix bundle protein
VKIEKFEQLQVWQHAHQLVLQVYHLTSEMPSDQRFGLCSQMQRAAVSIPANTAEGFKRHSPADKVRFYNIAQASLEELRYYFILCRDLGYRFEYEYATQSAESIARMLAGLIKSVRG